MPKKPKINKRLDDLFKDVQPEENAKGSATKPKLKQEAKTAPPSTPEPASIPKARTTPKAVSALQTGTLNLPPHLFEDTVNHVSGATYSTSFQLSDEDWATLRLVDEDESRSFSTDEQLLIRQVTDQLSLALENARLFQETQRRAQELSIVNQVVTSVAGSLDLKSTLQNVAENLVELLSSDNVGIALITPDKNNLTLAAEAFLSLERSTSIGMLLPIEGNPATMEVIRTKKPVFIRDTDHNPQAEPVRDALTERSIKTFLSSLCSQSRK